MILYVVRHGQTDANVSNILQGSEIDHPLTETGVQQVRALQAQLDDGIGALFASPHKRTRQSADILNEVLKKEVHIREELVERNFGSLTGSSFDTIENGSALQELDDSQEYDYHPYGGESADDVAARLNRFCNEIKTLDCPAVLAVTSRGPIRLFYKMFEKRIVVDIPNASLHTFQLP